MRAAQHQNVGIAGAILKDLVHIYMSDFFRHAMLDPAFFHQRHKKRARLFRSLHPLSLKSALISMACDGGLRGGNNHFFVFEIAAARSAPGSITPTTGTFTARSNVFKCQRRGRIAGDHQHFNSVFFKKMRGGNGVLRHGTN